jgi:hypothetical protein
LCIKRNGACEAIGATCGPELPLPLHTMGDIDGPPHMPHHTIANPRSASRRASHTGPSHMSKTLRVKPHVRRRRVAVGQVVSIMFDSRAAVPPLRLTARPTPCPLPGILSHCLLFSVPGALQQRVDIKLGITEEWLHALPRRTLGAAFSSCWRKPRFACQPDLQASRWAAYGCWLVGIKPPDHCASLVEIR